MARITVVTDETHRQHAPPFELNNGQRVAPVHERPERIDAIAAALRDAGHPRVEAEPQADAVLLDVHDADLIGFLRDGYTAWREAGGPEVMIADTFRTPRMAGGGRRPASPTAQLGWWCFDTATPLVSGSYAAARAAVDVAVTAADLLADGARAVYGLTRPPGHHAGVDYFGGFCLFNHAAIAARRLTAGGRVAILDVDAHHGNGTQDIFWRDGEVLYASLHGDPDHLFPYFAGFPDEIGEAAGRGTTRNLPLARGTSDDAYLDALTTLCDVVAAFDPTSVVVSLGVDSSRHDPIGSLALTGAAYARIGRMIAALGRPTLLLQEGGYALDHLGELTVDVLRAFDTPDDA